MKIGFAGLLTLIFVIAKLCGAISWSWWLVFLPLWIGLAIVGALFLIAVVAALIAAVFSK